MYSVKEIAAQSTPATVRQDMFDIASVHLLKQGRQSRIAMGISASEAGCAYRGEDNTACGVGCLIDDECIVPGMETKMVYSPLVQEALSLTGWNFDEDTDLFFLRDLQRTHDNDEPHRWEASLRLIAENWKLHTHAMNAYLITRRSMPA